MPSKHILFLGIVFIFLLALVLRLIIKNKLKEVYAVIWIFVVLSIPASILFYPLLVKVSGLVGFISPVNFSFVVGFLILTLISLHFSASNTNLENTLKNTVQRIALLEQEIKELKETIQEHKK